MALRLNGLKFPESDGSNGQIITTDGDGNLVFRNLDELPTINTSPTSVADLTDVDEVDVVDRATLVYNSNTQTYEIKLLPVDGGTF